MQKIINHAGEVVDEMMEGFVKAHPDQGITQIARSLRRTSKDLRLPVQKLLAEKKLKTTGQRRGTKYHAAGRGGVTTHKKAGKKRRVVKKAKRKITRSE